MSNDINNNNHNSNSSQASGPAPDRQVQPENEIFSNRRIAKNTLVLYARMIFMTLLGLFTSRVVLQVLGVTDYGVYSVVGGMIGMLGILSKSLSTAVSRYLTFELGSGDMKRLKDVFSTSVNVQLGISLVIVIVGATLGFWFLNTKMNIPPDRLEAANWVLWCFIISFVLTLVNVPYNAAIISHERMSVYAYMSIFEAVLQLAIVLSLYLSPFDKLKSYAVLGITSAIIVRAVYMIYCRMKFEECKYRFVFNVPLLKELLGFASWNLFGEGAWILNTQGIDILINMYFGVTLNAARGIAGQVNALSTKFVGNFMTALNPQITKTFAAGDLTNMHQLVCRGAKFSFFLTILFAIPLGFEAEKVLSIWLGIVPDYSVLFVRLTFASALCTVLGNTLVTAQFATGKIKRYQIIISICGFWVFPLTWLAFKLGGGPVWSYITFIVVYFGLIFVRIYLVKDMISMSWKMYFKEVLYRCGLCFVLAIIPPLVVYLLMPSGIVRLIVLTLVSVIATCLAIYRFGLQPTEKLFFRNQLNKYLKK